MTAQFDNTNPKFLRMLKDQPELASQLFTKQMVNLGEGLFCQLHEVQISKNEEYISIAFFREGRYIGRLSHWYDDPDHNPGHHWYGCISYEYDSSTRERNHELDHMLYCSIIDKLEELFPSIL